MHCLVLQSLNIPKKDKIACDHLNLQYTNKQSLVGWPMSTKETTTKLGIIIDTDTIDGLAPL